MLTIGDQGTPQGQSTDDGRGRGSHATPMRDHVAAVHAKFRAISRIDIQYVKCTSYGANDQMALTQGNATGTFTFDAHLRRGGIAATHHLSLEHVAQFQGQSGTVECRTEVGRCRRHADADRTGNQG